MPTFDRVIQQMKQKEVAEAPKEQSYENEELLGKSIIAGGEEGPYKGKFIYTDPYTNYSTYFPTEEEARNFGREAMRDSERRGEQLFEKFINGEIPLSEFSRLMKNTFGKHHDARTKSLMAKRFGKR